MSVNLYDETGRLLVHKEVIPSVTHNEYSMELFLFCSFDENEYFRWAQGGSVSKSVSVQAPSDSSDMQI